jgi:Uma2 family endonuclease
MCNWLDRQPHAHGEVLLKAPGIRLRTNPDTTIWADLTYLSAELARKLPEDASLIDGAPLLVVEVLSCRDTTRGLSEKVSDCLDAGVKLVWVANTNTKSVTGYRADGEPITLNGHDILSGEPALPGFRVPAGAVFA